MYRLFSLPVLGIAAVGLMLSLPSASQAGDWGYRGAGYGGYSGHYDRSYGRGYSGYGGYYNQGYGRGYSGYSGHYAPSYGRGYDSYYGRRPVIVHPTRLHWTPSRGWHEHGHIHVPHRGHYHTYPY